MIADYKEIANAIKKRQFAPIYFFDGDEGFYFDKLIQLFEEQVLTPAERDFNLSVLYGKDVSWKEVINTCRRFPMFSEYQVVILKDAASVSDFGELIAYVEQPSPTTILVLEYRNKKIDGKTKISKALKEKALCFTVEKLKDEAVPRWMQQFGQEIGFEIGPREAELLTLYLGNDLQKISNEIEKIRINVPSAKSLDGELIQKYIGISREYNVFDFPEAFSSGNKEKMYRMLSFFISSPKAAPMVLVTSSFFTHFFQLYRANFAQRLPEKDWGAAIGVSPYFAKNVVAKTRKWPQHKVEAILMVIAHYNAKAVGINSNESDAELLKEMIGKLELIEAA